MLILLLVKIPRPKYGAQISGLPFEIGRRPVRSVRNNEIAENHPSCRLCSDRLVAALEEDLVNPASFKGNLQTMKTTKKRNMRIQRAPSAGADANGAKELPSKCTDIQNALTSVYTVSE